MALLSLRSTILLIWLSCCSGQVAGFVVPGQRARYSRAPTALSNSGGFSLLRLGGGGVTASSRQRRRGKPNHNDFSRNANNSRFNNGNLAIQTAQLCLNQQKREEFKQAILRDFPMLPASAIETALELVAKGFQSVAPEILQECVTPGGLDKYREQLIDAVTETVCEQDAVQQFPLLSRKDKSRLVRSMVNLLVDQWFLDDDATRWLLASPTARLTALHQEIATIQRLEMTRRQVLWFNLQRHWRRYCIVTALMSFAAYAQWVGSVGAATSALANGLSWTCQWVLRQLCLRLWIFAKILGITLANHATMSYGPWDCLWVH